MKTRKRGRTQGPVTKSAINRLLEPRDLLSDSRRWLTFFTGSLSLLVALIDHHYKSR